MPSDFLTRLLLVAVVLLTACDLPPRFVREAAEIDAFVARRSYAAACVGLQMKSNDSLRTHTARRLVELPHSPVANSCLCEALYDAGAHTADLAVAEGLAGSRRDDLAACLAPAIEDPEMKAKARPAVVRALGAMDAPGAYEALGRLASSDPDPEVRAHAARALRPSEASDPVLLALLADDPEPTVRAAAAFALDGHRGAAVVDGVVAAALNDVDGEVRATALGSATSMKVGTIDDMVCTAMLEDPDERVREAAVRAWHGTKRKIALDCIDRRMRKPEESGAVRAALLASLGASPSDRAAKLLCDHIHPWMRMYVKDEIADRVQGANIVEVQNNRDWDRSYACVQAALRRGGLSCYARNHLGHWMKELGGKASTPWCPGMARN